MLQMTFGFSEHQDEAMVRQRMRTWDQLSPDGKRIAGETEVATKLRRFGFHVYVPLRSASTPADMIIQLVDGDRAYSPIDVEVRARRSVSTQWTGRRSKATWKVEYTYAEQLMKVRLNRRTPLSGAVDDIRADWDKLQDVDKFRLICKASDPVELMAHTLKWPVSESLEERLAAAIWSRMQTVYDPETGYVPVLRQASEELGPAARVAAVLRGAERMGAAEDVPEGTRYIVLSDTLANALANML